ncbi:MAG: UvrD-helicase domain-containing protein [Gemmatimonadaceae bacterium]
MSANLDLPLADAEARAAVRANLDTTMLVQAGAGSGKTTLMVDRLVAYVVRGTPIEQIAAVTFTRKAANELRERLENRLEFEARNAEHNEEQRTHLRFALRNRERMFIGTIHAFCGRVLREYALDAGLPPDFVELDESESQAQRANAWHNFLDHAVRTDNSLLTDVIALGIEPMMLAGAFEQREQYRDVEFPAPLHPRPAHTTVRNELLRVIEEGKALQHREGITELRDNLQKTLNRLWRRYRTHNEWQRDAVFAQDAATLLSKSSRDQTQMRWGSTKEAKAAAKAYKNDVDNFVANTLKPWFDAWWAHVYPHVITLLNAASDASLLERRRRGQLGFDDLLTETARLLRTNTMARDAIGARWRHLLVDEFQDTDPIQAEICFLLASDAQFGTDWTKVELRRGGLFVVGDPKQSIYRFRRADITTFAMVEERIGKYGQVVSLTNNFRSVPAIGTLVNSHFRDVFHSEKVESTASNHQARFAEFVTATTRNAHSDSGVWHFKIGEQGTAKNDELVKEDASRIASWIAARCTPAGGREPGDFLILTEHKKNLGQYARQLAVRNVPVDVSGAASESDKVLEELLIVLRAVADPSNPIAVIAALEGICFGCSHVDLWNAREAKAAFRITQAQDAPGSPVSVALQQLYEWWMESRRLTAASLVEHILDSTGLLVLAASDELGDRSAGHLLQLVSMLRNGNVGTDVASAITAIEGTLGRDDDDASLRAGETNTVRIMNLHKAKGLEAPVVILAAPINTKDHEQEIALWRDARGNAQGSLLIRDAHKHTLARAHDWDARAAAEDEREAEEEDRLLYVAVTRAKDELVVSRRAAYTTARKEPRGDESLWAKLARALDEHATAIEVVETDPPGRRRLQDPATQMAERIARSTQARADSSVVRYSIVSVTEAAKRNALQAEEDGASLAYELHEGNAVELNESNANSESDPRMFGSLVHLALEGALRGRSDAQLTQYVRAQVWHSLPESDESTLQVMTQRVLAAVAQATATNEWKALTAMRAVTLAELNVAHVSTRDGARVLAEGIIDVASFVNGQWTVVDWKNNGGSESSWQRALPSYQTQANAYAEALTARTGGPAEARIVRLTADR